VAMEGSRGHFRYRTRANRIDVARAMKGWLPENVAVTGGTLVGHRKDPRWTIGRKAASRHAIASTCEAALWRAGTFERSLKRGTGGWILSRYSATNCSRNCEESSISAAVNTDPIHVAYRESRYDFFLPFSSPHLSCAIGAAKPNPLIYREAASGLPGASGGSRNVDDIAAYAERHSGLASGVFNSSLPSN